MVNKSSNKDDLSQVSTPKLSVKDNTLTTSGGISKRLLTPCRRVGLSRKRTNTPTGLTPPFSTPKNDNKLEDDIDSTPKLKKTRTSKLCSENPKVSNVERSKSIRNLHNIDSEAVESFEDVTFATPPSNKKQKNTPVKNRLEIIESNKNLNKTKLKLDKLEDNTDTDEKSQQINEDFQETKSNTTKNINKEHTISEASKNTITDDDKPLSEFKKSVDVINESPIRECKVIIQKIKSKDRIYETSKCLMQRFEERDPSEFDNEDSVPLKRFKSINDSLNQSPTKEKAESEVNIDINIEQNNPKKNTNKTHTNEEVNLTKSCIKVIQSKILNKKESRMESYDSTDDDFDFSKQIIREKKISSKNVSPKLGKIKEKGLKTKETVKSKELAIKKSEVKPLNRSLSASKLSQNDDDDDFDFKTKKTILIRKNYNKNKTHLVRAKSTGSITEKDLEDIKRRIEQKKQRIMDAEKVERKTLDELKTAIEKWRVGCQQALNELLEIMKKNVPDKENMDIEELLRLLNIPIGLVKYNTEEFCFE